MTSFKDSKVGKVTIDVATSGLYLLVILYGFLEDQIDKVSYMMKSHKQNNNTNDSNNSAPPPTFREQLDKEAIESRIHQHESGETSTVQAVVDKISQVIPGALPMIGGSNPDGKVEHKEPPEGPPHRPENDAQIEEFVREQYRSNPLENLSTGKT